MGRQLPIKRSCSEIFLFAPAVEVSTIRPDMVPKYTSATLLKL